MNEWCSEQTVTHHAETRKQSVQITNQVDCLFKLTETLS